MRPKLTSTASSTIALFLLLDLFVIAWLAMLYVASQMFPDDDVRTLLAQIWMGKADVVLAFTGIGFVLVLYLRIKKSFNPILWAPIIMTGSVALSSFMAGILSRHTHTAGLTSTLSQIGIVLVLIAGIASMRYGIKYYQKYQCRAYVNGSVK